MQKHRYSEQERQAIYRVIEERRDMRHFRNDPVEEATIQRLLQAAHCAPSVGYMQPWRFIRIKDEQLRQAIHQLVEQERIKTAEALGKRHDEFMKLKVEGIKDCGELWVVALCEQRENYVFGRRTIPEMDLASASCAIQNIWLTARAEGLGMGWVSLFDPQELGKLLNMPDDALAIAILCIGHVDEFYDRPMLEQEGWAERLPLQQLITENSW